MIRIEQSDNPAELHIIMSPGELLAVYERFVGLQDVWSVGVANEIRHFIGELVIATTQPRIPAGALAPLDGGDGVPPPHEDGGIVDVTHPLAHQALPQSVLFYVEKAGILTVEDWAANRPKWLAWRQTHEDGSLSASKPLGRKENRTRLDALAVSLGLPLAGVA